MESNGFRQTTADPCVYVRTGNTTAIVGVHVDDLILKTKTSEKWKSSLQDEGYGQTALLSWCYS